MWFYIFRKILYSIPILITINIFTFVLFFCVNTPENIARNILGEKNVKPEMIHNWKKEHFYHLPTFLNLKDTIYYFGTPNTNREFLKSLSSYRVHITNVVNQNKESGVKTITEYAILKNEISGNSIFIIDPVDLSKEEIENIKNQFLSFGLPYLLVQTTDKSIESLSSSTIPVLSSDKIILYCDSLQASGLGVFTQTLFYQKAVQLFWFQFGKSDNNNIEIKDEILNRMGPSMMITVPSFILGLFLNIGISMIIAYRRGSILDRGTLIICIILMSLISLFYIIIAQFLFGFTWRIFPSSGYQEGFDGIRFVIMPIIISLIMGIGGGVRFYRTIFLEEINKDFVRTARSKGLSEFSVLFKHTLKCAMIPILTGVVVAIPGLITGGIIMENFFAIPGLGAFTLEGIEGQDFRIVGSMVYLGSFMYVVALILTDIAYTWVDPRVKLS
jgi:peptide/nickel transport system permease protein